jgi:hypothetical protein
MALAAAALIAAGCGGGGDQTTATPTQTAEETAAALSKDELITQGDGICAEVNAAVGTIGEGGGEESETVQIADLYGGMIDRIKGLGTPSEAEGYAEFVEAADELDQAESDAKLAAEREDANVLAEAESSASSALTSFQEEAEAYGFEDCAEGPSAPIAGAPGGSTGS